MIAVGCPVRNRAWILPAYFDHIDKAFAEVGEKPSYVFAIGTCTDDTEAIIETHDGQVTHTVEGPMEEGRYWTGARFAEMTAARNALLDLVRSDEPDLFLSIDSDILLHPATLPQLVETIASYATVGGKCYMKPMGHDTPSYTFPRPMGGLVRPDADGVFEVDVIMALKLMTPDAYNVDYVTDDKGEDVGWSLAVRRAGHRLAWDGRTINKHVMLRRQLYEVDPRCGY